MKSLNFDSTNELPNPVLVRASKVGKIVLGWNPKTAANWRSQKIGWADRCRMPREEK